MKMAESPDTIGRYEILEIIGKGAMGVVYKARDPNIDRIVAIKAIRADELAAATDGEELLARFRREVQTAGELTHSNIVTIHDGGQDGDLHWLAMEYVDGPSLDKVIGDKIILPLQDILSIFVKICSAIDFAHRHNIIHRDLKPANILLTPDWEPKIADFGIARIASSTMTRTGVILGTPSYMSPEQITGQRVDSRSDIFSLGIILYELITGERPYLGDNPTTIMYKIVHSDPVPPESLNMTLPNGLSGIVMKSLSKNPEDRYQRAGDMANDLINLVRSSPELSVATSRLDMPTARFAPGAAGSFDTYQSVGAPRAEKKKNRLPMVLLMLIVIAGAIAGGVYYLSTQSGAAGGGEPAGNGGEIAAAESITREITVTTETEGASVYVDGKLQEGTTPVTLSLTRPEGSSALLVVEQGCYAAEEQIAFDSSDPLERAVELKPKVRRVALDSEPSEADVSVNGRNVGKTPLDLEIECGGEYTVVVSAYAHRSETRTLDYESAGESSDMMVALPVADPGTVTFRGAYPVNVFSGQRRLRSNVSEIQLPPGRHRLTLVSRRHFLMREYTVDVREGQSEAIDLPQLGVLSVFSRPAANCVIEIDGFRLTLEEIPLRQRPVASGSHQIKFTWGDITRSGVVEVPPGGAINVLGAREMEEITVRSAANSQ